MTRELKLFLWYAPPSLTFLPDVICNQLPQAPGYDAHEASMTASVDTCSPQTTGVRSPATLIDSLVFVFVHRAGRYPSGRPRKCSSSHLPCAPSPAKKVWRMGQARCMWSLFPRYGSRDFEPFEQHVVRSFTKKPRMLIGDVRHRRESPATLSAAARTHSPLRVQPPLGSPTMGHASVSGNRHKL